LILGCLGDPAPRRGSREDLASEWSEAWYHNSAAALLDGDRIVAAVEEERLTRRKETGKFPFDAIEYCLSSVGATLDDLAWIAFGEVGGPGEWRDPRISQARIADVLRSRLPSARELTTRIQLVDHHLGHAYSAYVPSSFERALVFTSDGFGDGRSGLVAIGRDGQDVTPISTISFANSLGRFYSSVLPYLGYRGGDEYKVMGLAPYGDPTVYRDVFARLYTLLPSGGYRIASHDAAAMTHRLSQMAPQRRNGSPIEQAHKDVAAAVQEAFEQIVFHILSHWRAHTNETALCLAGGTAQNSSCNGKLLSSGLFERLYVQPASHDAGIALGAAFHARLQARAGSAGRLAPPSPYLGPAVPEGRELQDVIARWSDYLAITWPADIADSVASLLAGGQVAGWVQGHSEFGPRALGNRSILADPRDASQRRRVNAAIKMRESYRPFAPAVKRERAAEYFVMPAGVESLPFMTCVVPVQPRARTLLPAVTHVDGSARVQTVGKEDNELFWRLLDAFESKTGVPVLLNTSFNTSAEPIVQSVDDAIACFLTTSLDALAVGGAVCIKRSVEPAMWLRLVPRLRSDVMLSTFPGEGPRCEPVHAVIAQDWRSHTISARLFRLLAAADGRPLYQWLPAFGWEGEANALGQELRELWNSRLVLLTPGPVI